MENLNSDIRRRYLIVPLPYADDLAFLLSKSLKDGERVSPYERVNDSQGRPYELWLIESSASGPGFVSCRFCGLIRASVAFLAPQRGRLVSFLSKLARRFSR